MWRRATRWLGEAGLVLWVLLVGLAVFGGAEAKLDADEALTIGTTSYFQTLFVEHDLSPASWADERWTQARPMVGRYILGAWLWSRGYDLRSLDRYREYDRGASPDANRRAGLAPSDELIRAARAPMRTLMGFVVLTLYLIVRILVGPIGGVVAALLVCGNPYLREQTVRATADAPLMLFLLGTLLAAVVAHARAGRGVPSWRWAVVAGGLLGLALGTQLTAVSGAAALIVWAIWAWRWPRAECSAGGSPSPRPGQASTALGRVARTPFAWTFLLLLAMAVVFVAGDPFLYPDPVGRTWLLFCDRAEELALIEETAPSRAVPNLRRRLGLVWERSFLHDTWGMSYVGWPVEPTLALVGTGWLAVRAFRRGAGAEALVLLWVACMFGGVTWGLRVMLRLEDHFVPTVTMAALLAGLGAGWGGRAVWAYLSVDASRRLGPELERGRLAVRCRLVARRAPWLWPYGGLAMVLGLVLWPAWFTPQALIIGSDALTIHYPWFVLWRDALAAGELPFWNPYTFSGLPAFATLQAGYGYPPHWAFTWAPAITTINWMVGLHVLLAGLGAAWCAGRLGASKEGQFLGGAAYALGSAMSARLWAGHLSFLETNAWLPLATGLAIQVGSRQAVVYLALVVGLMTLAGQPEILIFSLWWLPLWGGLAGLGTGVRGALRALVRVGLGVGLGIGLAAFQLLPVLQVLAISNRQAGATWDYLTAGSLPPWHLLELLSPLAFGDPRQTYWPGPRSEWHERLFYIGLVPLLAAIRAPGRWRWICWGCAGLAVALAFGHYVPWYAWAQVLPGYTSFRIPSKHLTLAALALALAAGLGIERLHGRRVALTVLVGAALLALGGLWFRHWFPVAMLLLGGSERLAEPAAREVMGVAGRAALQSTSFVLVLVAAVALLPAGWARRGMLLLAVVELGVALQPFRIRPSDPQSILADAGMPRDHPRAAVVGSGGAVLANFGPVLRVTQPAGYVSLFSSEYMALLTGTVSPAVIIDVARGNEPILHLLGYAVVVDRGTSQVTVAEPPPPRVWVARCAWPGAAREVREPDFPRQACVTRAAAAGREQPTPAGPARLVAERAGWLEVEAEGPGWLVTTQPWYPGWSARLDGQPAPVEVVDGALVGLALPAGRHTITLHYRPAGLELGVLLSVGVTLVLLVWWWRGRRPTISGPR